jgi:hypothetical protein
MKKVIFRGKKIMSQQNGFRKIVLDHIVDFSSNFCGKSCSAKFLRLQKAVASIPKHR